MRALMIWARCLCLALLVTALPAQAEKRVALVIGNAVYQNTPNLTNPPNDANDVGTVLERLGFQVFRGADLDKRGMDRTIAQFARAATEADAALFFYAGHGMQFQGQNYLMPTDAKLEDEVSLTFEMTRVDDVLSALGRARGVKLLILDACRDNPLARRLQTRSNTRAIGETRGFARIERAQGTLIAFATQANELSFDGVERNSPFTAALLKDIETPNLEVGALFRRVTAEVNRVTSGRQTPELSVSILGEFYFKQAETDQQVWPRLSTSSKRTDFVDFIGRFPQSPFAELAKSRIASIDKLEADKLAGDQAERLRRDEENARRARELRERDLQEARVIADRRRETAERARLDHERVLKDLAERERKAKEELARLAAAVPAQPVPPLVIAATPVPTAPVVAAPIAPPGLTPPPPTVIAAAPPPTLPVKPLPAATPQPDRGAVVIETKKELARLGCFAGPVDPRWPTPVANKAVADFAKHAGLTTRPDAPSAGFLDVLKEKAERVCPLVCARGAEAREGVCVAVARPPEVKPARPVATPPVAKPRPIAQPRAKPAPPRAVAKPRPPAGGGGGRCFNFNGQRFCE